MKMKMTKISKHIHGTQSGQRNILSSFLFMLGQLFISCFLFVSASQAELKSLSPDELKSSTAQAGLVDFSINNTTARIFLDIHIETQATIESLSAGWYEKDVGAGPTSGWDQKWNGVTLGNSTESLSIDGLVFRADFDDLSAPDPVLQRIVVGSNRLQGNLAAEFASFSGIYNDILTGGAGSPVSGLSRTSLGNVTFNFNSNAVPDSDSRGLFFILNTSGSNIGIQVVAGYNEHNIPTTSPGPWWNSP
jgi:hypothetical protein